MQTRSFSPAEALVVAGISNKMLAQAVELGLIAPFGGASPGRGTDRRYTFGDLMALRILRHLRDVGFRRSSSLPLLAWLARSTADTALFGYVLLTSDGEFTIVPEKKLVQQLSVSSTPICVVLHLNAIHQDVVAGAAECRFSERPRRGRRPGEIAATASTGRGESKVRRRRSSGR